MYVKLDKRPNDYTPPEINKHVVEVGDVFTLTLNNCHDFVGMDTGIVRKYKAIKRYPHFMLCLSLEGPKTAHHNRAIDYLTLQSAQITSRASK